MVSIFEYEDYVSFLTDWISSRPKKGRGIKTDMAHYMGCLPAHITKVLNRSVHLTLEQAAKTLSFLELSNLEGHYFLGLVELGRAGNKELQDLIFERLEGYREQIQTAKRAGAKDHGLSQVEKDLYYSTWHFLAVEILVSCPRYQTVEAIGDCLGITKKQAMEVINFLAEKNIIQREGEKFIRSELGLNYNIKPGPTNNRNHHKNWRTRAEVSLDQEEETNINFTGVYSMPKVLVPVMRDFLVNHIMEFWKVIDEHPDDPDEAFGLCIDFFNLSRPKE